MFFIVSGPEGDYKLKNQQNTNKLNMCKTEGSSLHETESTSSTLDENVYGTNNTHIRDLNVLRKKLNMLEITDTSSSDSEKSLHRDSFSYAAGEHPLNTTKYCEDIHKSALTKNVRKISKQIASKNSERDVDNPSPQYNLEDVYPWSVNLPDFQETEVSKVNNIETPKSYMPPEKKMCVRETTPHIPEQNSVFMNSEQQGSSSVSAFTNGQVLFVDTFQEQNAFEATEDFPSDNFANLKDLERAENSNNNLNIPRLCTKVREKRTDEFNFVLNLPSSIDENSSNCTIPTVKTTIISNKPDNSGKKNKTSGRSKSSDTVKSEFSSVSKYVDNKESSLSHSVGCSVANLNLKNYPGCSGDENFYADEDALVNTDIDKTELGLDILLASDICQPVKPKVSRKFPAITKITNLVVNLKSGSSTQRNSSNTDVNKDKVDLETDDSSSSLNFPTKIEPKRNFSSYKDVAEKLMALKVNKMKNSTTIMKYKDEATNSTMDASEPVKCNSSKDMLKIRKAQSTEISFYSLPSGSTSLNSSQSLQDSKINSNSESDGKCCTGCFCVDIFFSRSRNGFFT